MDTKPLERFATQARREVLAAVDAQATAVLAPGSVTRTERGEVVKKLEAEIAAHGRGHVIDKVAYTWFNRIIALRFMDARNYTDAGVVSPARSQAHGQPEILADAKRGNLNTDVVSNKNTAEAIIGLLDGTRRSTDAEGEAYSLLLTEYCRYWHKSMPFMFEREGDYTELLVPTGLLADGATLSRAREVLTEEVCEDVEVIGWLYQFYISERKQEIFNSKAKRGAAEIPAATQLFTPHWIVRYLVENSLGRLWLLNRPSSRLTEQMDYYVLPVGEETDWLEVSSPEELKIIDPACGSGHMLTYAFDLLYAIYEEEGYAPSDIPGLILSNNLYGTEIDARAGALAAFAITMKARDRQRTFFNNQVQPNICVLEPISFTPAELHTLLPRDGNRHDEEAFWNQFQCADTFGSLIQPHEERIAPLRGHLDANEADEADLIGGPLFERARRVLMQAEYLSTRYHVVVANPPYMGSGSMGPKLAEFAKREYAGSKSDLFAMFIERNLSLAVDGGNITMITMQSWMFLSSFLALRRATLSASFVSSMAHLGTKAFDSIGGEVVATTAFVLEKKYDASAIGQFMRLVDHGSEAKKSSALSRICRKEEAHGYYIRRSGDFLTIPGQPIAYWLDDGLKSAFSSGRPLGDVAKPVVGLQTGENERFLRLWHEVGLSRLGFAMASRDDALQSGRKWFPYNKGGSFRRWYGNQEFVVNWEYEGREIIATKPKSVVRNPQYYFKKAITWSDITTDSFAARLSPQGFMFDVKGSSGFPDEPYFNAVLALLNSGVTHEYMLALNPTSTFQVGDLSRIPFVDSLLNDERIFENVDELISLAKSDWDSLERSWDFEVNPLVVRTNEGTLHQSVSSWLNKISNQWRRTEFLELQNNELIGQIYGFNAPESVRTSARIPTLSRATMLDGSWSTAKEIVDLISYAVGCMFGRYSLDTPGLVLADQGDTLAEYLAKVPSPSFMPDVDNVIPFVDDGWFEDDIVERFRQFLRAAFGAEHFEENLHFIEESLGVRTLRDYFITRSGKSKFYDEHVQRYKKRPIYWMFSSPKGSFNALIYMHRYDPATVSTVLNEYLREYRAKLEVACINAEQAAAAGSPKDQKEADRLRKVLSELRDYEHDVLYPFATQQLAIDLDDGVRANYPKFYPALKKITGLEAAE